MARKWIRGANGLWSSLDLICLRKMGRMRAQSVRARLSAVLARDGWERRGSKWAKSAYWAKKEKTA